ncbi:MAG: putative lipid II flippase FtsW [Treponema sp.]|nr:putative lipid II flippase FtsW [Treponema sp.]
MYHFDVERIQGQKILHLFYLSVILLLGTGLVSLYSASYAFAQRVFNNGNHLITRQLIFAAIGIVLFFVFSNIKLDFLRKHSLTLVLIAAFLCGLTFVPGIGVERYGASRWIEVFSMTYQPSEFVKFALPLYLAHLLDKKHLTFDNFFSGVLPPIIVTSIFFTLINFQNNFSTAVFIAFNAIIIIFLAGMPLRYFLMAIGMIVPISMLLIFTREHRVIRVLSFFRPEWDPLGAGFQVSASRQTIVSSGFFGLGIGEGIRKVSSIPEVHSDFIFSAYVEETGFLGIILFFVLFAAFAYFGYRTAWNSDTLFKKLLAAGLTTMVITQMLLNIGVVSGALPATGIPLPFFSAGGSSLITTLICAGLIANVAKTNLKIPKGSWETGDE